MGMSQLLGDAGVLYGIICPREWSVMPFAVVERSTRNNDTKSEVASNGGPGQG